MSVIDTKKWILKCWNDPIKLCGKLTDYFHGANPTTIYHHLITQGMYQLPLENEDSDIQEFVDTDVWKIIREQEEKLKSEWDGPNIPILIFPADSSNRELMGEFDGKSGVAFQDKLFLFTLPHHSKQEVNALFTHEYHHTCRLAHYDKKVRDYTLLDTIILEGLAEHAVAEQVGEEYNAKWTTYYNEYQLEKMWQRLLSPARDLPKNHPKHYSILYGGGLHPKMAGYAVGYYLVTNYVDKNKLSSKELLTIPSEEIAKIVE